MGNRAKVVALATTAVLSISAVQAKEVRYPAAHPRFSLIVPDDWKVDETSLGLELQSPQKDSLVLAAETGADRKSVDAWSKRALERMRDQGVVFAQTGTTAPAAPLAAEARSTGATDFATRNGDRPYTFGDAPPTIAPPPIANADKTTAARVGDADLPTISDFAIGGNASAMKPSGHFLYTGGRLNGKPVDVELTLFSLDKGKRLLFEQQSGPTDARGVRIMSSLHDLTQ